MRTLKKLCLGSFSKVDVLTTFKVIISNRNVVNIEYSLTHVMTLCPPAKPHDIVTQDNDEQPQSEDEPKDNQNDLEQTEEEEEDPYNLFPEDIYDSVDANCICIPIIQNRPPAPIPRSEDEPEIEDTMKYISRGTFCFHVTHNVLFTHQIS